MLVEKDKAYFLHSKPYRENSLIAHLFTKKNGKVSFIINGVKSTRVGKTSRSPKTSLLQPCHPLIISYQLKNGLSKITNMELQECKQLPSIKYFMLYQYINELLLKLLPEQFSDENIFNTYQNFLSVLASGYPNFSLRLMELSLLDYFEGITGLYQDESLLNKPYVMKYCFINRETGITPLLLNNSDIRITNEQLSAFNYVISFYKKYLSNDKRELSDDIEIIAKEAQPISTFFITRLLGNKELKTKKIYRELQIRELL